MAKHKNVKLLRQNTHDKPLTLEIFDEFLLTSRQKIASYYISFLLYKSEIGLQVKLRGLGANLAKCSRP